MADVAGFFDRSDDSEAIQAIESALVSAGYDPAEVSALCDKLRSRLLLRWFVLRYVRGEIAGAGRADKTGRIDWPAISDFLIAIAPIIFELIKLFT